MSVPVGLRGENLSVVFTLSSELLALVIRTAASSKHFPHKLTRELGEPCVSEARLAMHDIYCAGASVSDASARETFSDSALRHLDCLKAELTMNFLSFHLSSKKGCELADKISELQSKLRNWKKATC